MRKRFDNEKEKANGSQKPENQGRTEKFAGSDKSAQKTELEQKSVKDIRIVATPMLVGRLATLLDCHANTLILWLLQRGIVASKNDMLTEEQVAFAATALGAEVEKPTMQTVTVREGTRQEIHRAEGEVERAPVVVIVGHVDHGKTTLLDFIRKARVASTESGGITQSIGAYEVELPWTEGKEKLVFIDTPGHEAFFAMRRRGIKVADLAVLVVAADDGVMPQTLEALKQITDLGVPIVVAINKVDKVEQKAIENVKQQLSRHGVLLEEWGGDVISVLISAKLGTGISKLLEMLVLQAKLLDLRANPSGVARGFVLESEIEKGRGPVATVILQQGSLSIGDYFVAGETTGCVTSLVDSYGRRIKTVGVSTPVRISGFSSLASPGDLFRVIAKEEFKSLRSERQKSTEHMMIKGASASPTESIASFILKADTNSSREALVDAMSAIAKSTGVTITFVSSAVGPISDSDIELAVNSGASIVGFRVKPLASAKILASQSGIEIKLYDVIYKLLEHLETFFQQHVLAKSPKAEMRKVIGVAEVLQVFDIKNVGVIAGCKILEGRIVRDGLAVIKRKTQEVGRGKITSLQRERRVVKEAHAGFECGFTVEGFSEWKIGDRVECLA